MKVFKPGDKVKHPFAGEGVVVKSTKATVHVRWKRGGKGGAHPYDLSSIEPIKKAKE